MFPLRWNFPFRKKDGSLVNIGDAMGGDYSLPTASTTTKGGVKVGSGLSMDGEVLNNSNPTPYSLPTASDKIKGGVKVGSGLSMNGEILYANSQLPAYGALDEGKLLSVNSEGDLIWLTPDSGGKVYYKDFTNLTWESIITIVENSLYYHTTTNAINLNVDGYSPIGGVAIDVYTGYRYLGAVEFRAYSGVQKAGNFSVINTRSDNDGISIRMFYVKNEDIEAIT